MNQIARCDWLPERATWSHLALARSGLPAESSMKNFPESHVINPLLTKFVRSRWLDIGLVLFFASLWTETKSRSINTEKRTWPISSHLDQTNLVNNPFLFPSFSWGIFGHVTCLDQSRPRENIWWITITVGSNKNQNIKLLPQNPLPTEIFCHCPFLEPPRIKSVTTKIRNMQWTRSTNDKLFLAHRYYTPPPLPVFNIRQTDRQTCLFGVLYNK